MRSIFFLFYASFFFGCTSTKDLVKYSRNYIEVGKIMDSVQLPYIIRLTKGEKELIAIGISHTYDAKNPQLGIVKNEYRQFNPDIVINEGGKIVRKFQNEEDAIKANGEVGLLKYLSDMNHRTMENGDIEDSLEYRAMLKFYSKDDLLLYYIMERLIVPYLNGAYGQKDIEGLYSRAIKKWFISEGFPITEDLMTFEGYRNLYKTKIGHNLELSINPDIELFDYVNPHCKYCEIGRESKVLRDSNLLDKIYSELKNNNKTMVVFGHGHILAIEPALRKMMKKF